MANKQQISEDLKRFKSIIGYDVTGKKKLNEAPEDEFDFGGEEGGDETADKETGDEFDFGADEGGDKAADTEGGDFDFGDEGSPEDEAGAEDEFGTADEFSAADDIEMAEDDVEEIDVTDIVNKSEDAKKSAEEATQLSQQTNSFVKDLMDKFSNLEAQLTKMDTIMSKVSKIESDIKTPEEKLELRSLDSYPFNMKLTDYWSDKMGEPDNNYSVGGENEVYEITKDDLKDYNEIDIKNSFNPKG